MAENGRNDHATFKDARSVSIEKGQRATNSQFISVTNEGWLGQEVSGGKALAHMYRAASGGLRKNGNVYNYGQKYVF